MLLFYALDGKSTWNGAWRPHDPEYVRKSYRYDDSDGRGPFTTSPLHADGLTGGRSEYEYRGHFRAWKHPLERMLALEEEGLSEETTESKCRSYDVNACRLTCVVGRSVEVDDLVDAQGVADLLGLAQRNTVSLYQRRYPAMPRPVVDLGRGRCKM